MAAIGPWGRFHVETIRAAENLFTTAPQGGGLKLTAGNRDWLRRPISREIDGGGKGSSLFSVEYFFL
jgi:hypothetical protein